ncbi:MAG: hypothetical protein ACRD8A_20440 [Candidatus Acidiferrales bacterium]
MICGPAMQVEPAIAKEPGSLSVKVKISGEPSGNLSNVGLANISPWDSGALKNLGFR